jgi:hypothetical protein
MIPEQAQTKELIVASVPGAQRKEGPFWGLVFGVWGLGFEVWGLVRF